MVFKENKNKTNGEICSDDKAIEWALKNTNTTKDYSIYGFGGYRIKRFKSLLQKPIMALTNYFWIKYDDVYQG